MVEETKGQLPSRCHQPSLKAPTRSHLHLQFELCAISVARAQRPARACLGRTTTLEAALLAVLPLLLVVLGRGSREKIGGADASRQARQTAEQAVELIG